MVCHEALGMEGNLILVADVHRLGVPLPHLQVRRNGPVGCGDGPDKTCSQGMVREGFKKKTKKKF